MKPPFTITPGILNDVNRIERLIGRIEGLHQPKPQPYLRKSNRVKTVQGSLAIEGNTLGEEQVTALLDGKTVIGEAKDILEVKNAIAVYDRAEEFDPFSLDDLLAAHKGMMSGLINSAGRWRKGNVGIFRGEAVAHVAPKADRVHGLMSDLFDFLRTDDHPLLIRGCVFHYELEFIHPFDDGNGRIGRFWHSVLLQAYHPVFRYIPVESLIRDHQKSYYEALEQSDSLGDSTPFIAFSLSIIHQSLADYLDALKPEPLTVESRLDLAAQHFEDSSFSRKDYMALLKNISSATASRDLKTGLDEGLLTKNGAKAQTRYRFA